MNLECINVLYCGKGKVQKFDSDYNLKLLKHKII